MMLCDRPLARNVDFVNSRFVVCTGSGLQLAGRRLERGEEVPRGILSPDDLRMAYELPLRQIEVLEFALEDPSLREACARFDVFENKAEGKKEEPPSQPPKKSRSQLVKELEAMSRSRLDSLAKENGVSSSGSTKQVRSRLLEHLV